MVKDLGPFLPSPPPMPETWIRTAGQPSCMAARGVGWDGDLMCDLVQGHPGDWHYEPDVWFRSFR